VTFPVRSIGTARTTPRPIAGFVMLAALLAGCSSETAHGVDTSDGTITGVITTTNAFPAPRHGSVLPASARGASDRVPLLTAPGIASFLSRLPRAALRARRLPRRGRWPRRTTYSSRSETAPRGASRGIGDARDEGERPAARRGDALPLRGDPPRRRRGHRRVATISRPRSAWPTPRRSTPSRPRCAAIRPSRPSTRNRLLWLDNQVGRAGLRPRRRGVASVAE